MNKVYAIRRLSNPNYWSRGGNIYSWTNKIISIKIFTTFGRVKKHLTYLKNLRDRSSSELQKKELENYLNDVEIIEFYILDDVSEETQSYLNRFKISLEMDK